jgi:hypothetical protein
MADREVKLTFSAGHGKICVLYKGWDYCEGRLEG